MSGDGQAVEVGVSDEVPGRAGGHPVRPPGMPTFSYGPVGGDVPLVPAPGAPPRGPERPADAGGTRRTGRDRRVFVVAVLVVLGLLAAAITWWPRTQGAATGSASQVVDGLGPTTAPERSWEVDLVCGEQRTSTVGEFRVSVSGPLGCPVAADADQVYVATRDGGVLRLAAHARTDGMRRWQTDLPGDEARLLVLRGLVLVAGFADDGTDQVVAIDAGSGTERWRTPGLATGWGDGGATVVARGGLDGARFAAVDLAAGTDRWQRTGELLAVCPGVVLGATGSNVVAHDLASGDRLWQDPKGGRTRAACAGDEAYVLEGDRLTARAARGGEERWRATVPAQAHLHVLDDLVVASTAVQAVGRARSDGAERWTVDLEDRSNLLLQGWQPVGDGRVFVAWDERFDVVDAATGDRLASEPAGDLRAAAWGQGLVVRIEGGQAVALTARGLERIWATPVPADADGVALGGGTLYVTGGGTLTAYD